MYQVRLNQSISSSSSSYSSSSNKCAGCADDAKELSVSVQSSQNIINGKGKSNITATAFNAATGKKLDIATVKLKITIGSNLTIKEVVGHKGEVKYSVDSPVSSMSQKHNNVDYNAMIEASAPGYVSTTKIITYSSLSAG